MSEQSEIRDDGLPAGTDESTVPVVRRPGPRVSTVVWGLVVTALAIGLMAFGNGVVFDVQLATIVLVAAAGVALLVGSLLGARRRAE